MTPRTLVFDLECSDLKADYGSLLCMGYKWLGQKKIHCPSLLDHPGKWALDDELLVKEAHKIISQADMLIGFYSSGHDIKYLRSKFLEHGLPVLDNVPHLDLYFLARSNLNLSRKSLDNLSRYLKLDKRKYYVGSPIWKRAKAGDVEGLKEVIRHCRADVAVTEEMYYKLRPLSKTHPRLNGWEPCRVCGSSKLQRRGFAVSSTKGKQIRTQCTNCGHWENRSQEHAEAGENISVD